MKLEIINLNDKKIVKNLFKFIGYECRKINELEINRVNYPYLENEEIGGKNLVSKLERFKNGGPFEWENITDLNQSVASLCDDAKHIADLGCGTGDFAKKFLKKK